MPNHRSWIILLLLSVTLWQGCASIVSGSTQTVSFTSNPEGATIELDGRTLGKAPLSITLKKRSHQRITATLPGYKTVTLPLETRQNGWFWGNIVIGGFIGSTTDGVTGAVNEYSPSNYMISLPREGSAPIEGMGRQTDSQKIKEFIFAGYRQIAEDLRRGKGEYRDSLLSLLKVPTEERDVAAKKLAALLEAYPDIPQFAERAMDLSHANGPSDDIPSAETAQAAPTSDIKETFGSPPLFYDRLCALPISEIAAVASRATPPQREALTRYITTTKGTTRVIGWTFQISGHLKPSEKECINRFLLDNSGYKPVY